MNLIRQIQSHPSKKKKYSYQQSFLLMNKQAEHGLKDFPSSKASDPFLPSLLCCSQVPRFLISQEKSTIHSTQDLDTKWEATWVSWRQQVLNYIASGHCVFWVPCSQQLCRVTQREGLHPSLLPRDWLAHFPHQQPSAAPVLDQTFLSRLFSFPGSF